MCFQVTLDLSWWPRPGPWIGKPGQPGFGQRFLLKKHLFFSPPAHRRTTSNKAFWARMVGQDLVDLFESNQTPRSV
jgi:hypothetical protein